MDSSSARLAHVEHDALRMDSIKSTTISFACRDNRGGVLQLMGKTIGDCSILIMEILAVRESYQDSSWTSLPNVIVENDSQVVIISIGQDCDTKADV